MECRFSGIPLVLSGGIMNVYFRCNNIKKIYAIIIVILMLFSIMPTVPVYAEVEYGYQGLTGIVETDKGAKDYNNIKLIEPSDITVLKTGSKPGEYFLNRINTIIDGSTGRIDFSFSMTAGMNNIGEPGNWNFFNNNLNPDPEQDSKLAGKKTQVNIYAIDKDDEYTGEDWSANKTPLINYNLGNLFIDDNKTYANITNGDGTGRIALYTNKVLESGDYILEFGAETCGNNVEKILGVPVAFRFTVKGKYTFDEAKNEAQSLYDEAYNNTGNEIGEYRDDGTRLAELKQAIDEASALTSESTVEERDSAAEKLSNAIEKLKKVQVVDIEFGEITGISESVGVGGSGTADVAVNVNPSGNGDFKRYTYETSDNIQIDSKTGAWTALWEGAGWIKVTSKWHEENPESVPDGKNVATKKRSVYVNAENDVLALGIPKGSTDDGKSMLQTVTEKAINAGVSINTKKLKIYTARGAELESEDFAYIRDTFSDANYIDISKASVALLPNGAFQGMTSLETIKLPDKLSKISTCAFKGCNSLKDVCISSGVTFIGDEAFFGCESLDGAVLTIKAVTPPEVTQYPSDAFGEVKPSIIKVPYGCGIDYKANSYWKRFTIEEDPVEDVLTVKVTKTGGLQEAAETAISAQSMESESNVDTLIVETVNNAVLDYAEDIPYLQENFLNATTIDLSEAVIEDNKFKSNILKNRKSLKKMRLHDDITNIAGNAFYGCSNLEDIILPKALEKIGNGAFSGCNKLKTIITDSTVPPMFDGTVFPQSVNTIIVPASALDSYCEDEAWNQFEIVSQYKLSLNKSSVEIEAPNSVTLTANVTVYGSCGDTVFWESSNKNVATVSASTGKTVTVKGLKAGTATITAKDVTGNVKATCKVTVKAMAAPDTVKAASAAYNKIKVTWTGVSGAQKYQVFRCNSKGTPLKLCGTFGSTVRSFTETGLTTGTTYYYKVRAYKVVSGTTYNGSYSALKSAKPLLSTPGTPSVSKYSSKYVKVKWKGISGESGYQVYRATSKTSKYTKVASVKMTSSSYPYAKVKATKGKTYYYKVRAYKNVGSKPVYSSFSNPKAYKLK